MVIIYCISCDQKKEVDIDQLKKGKFFECERCEANFNLYGVYDFFYRGIDLVKKIVDILTDAVYSGFYFKGNENDLERITQFQIICDFNSLLKDIVHDTILFGNSFIEIVENECFLKRLDLTNIEIITSWKQKLPRRSFTEEIDKLIQQFPKRREIDRSKLFHFVGDIILPETLGRSVLGFYFTTWYNIVFNKVSPIAGIQKSGIIGASGIPRGYLMPDIPVTTREQKGFLQHVMWRRERISRVIDKEILPSVLGKPFDSISFPRIKFSNS